MAMPPSMRVGLTVTPQAEDWLSRFAAAMNTLQAICAILCKAQEEITELTSTGKAVVIQQEGGIAAECTENKD